MSFTVKKGKVVNPTHHIIEKIALELAAVFYEAGRSSGLTSKFKSARQFAAHNLEKFIPKSVELSLEMLKPTSNLTAEAREELWAALQERINDPELCAIMPNNDIPALQQQLREEDRKKIYNVIGGQSAPKAKRH